MAHWVRQRHPLVKALLVIIVVWMLWMLVAAVGNSKLTPKADAAQIPAAPGLVQQGTDSLLAPTSVTPGSAASSGCPDWVVYTDPVTGGTGYYDLCTEPAATSYTLSQWEGATASSGSGQCHTAHRKVWVNNRVGHVFWVNLEKYWCWRSGKITSTPPTTTSSGVTTLGYAFLWRNDGMQWKNTYNSPDGWLSTSGAGWKFHIEIPTILGGITISEYQPTAHIQAQGNGSWGAW